ncbi:3-phosphoglycerate dehydrogenase [Pontibacillus halophilus JSM 076056 = DSM 19796]|uniref:3-phosphoglycerate dehydrogenase n=1 Tax=Pontibacillus halophilus JSM 076056 = DSM 19796 TaxID=1385510 RepID=A0A0A5G6L2_9BACI|nr:D-2-hydroxyacid dehydrogenase [Pontibacillus halophilus]KGX87679.1 3-phosphoglycerate dehydrogenase [Pontibacillus halophilus JSM 076056 = DSM 19796]
MLAVTTCKVQSRIQAELVEKYPMVTFQFCESMEEAEAYLSRADLFITYGEDVTPEHIKAAPLLKWIMVLSAGMDKMPFKEIEARKIMVTNARGIHAIPMAEYAIGMLLQTYRESKTIIEYEKAHKWGKSLRMNELTGRTMLIVGAGAIGQELGRLAKAFRIKTIGISRSGTKKEYMDVNGRVDDLDEYLSEADIVVSILPSTKETRYLFTESSFKKMKDDAIFLNMGRGDVVQDTVLMDALHQRQIAYAILDVFEQEPLPAAHPFWSMERVTVTPHHSGVSPQYQPRAFEIFKHNLDVFLNEEGDYQNVYDWNRGY